MQTLMREVHLDGVAERLDPGEPRTGVPPKRGRRTGWLGSGRQVGQGSQGNPTAQSHVSPSGYDERSTHRGLVVGSIRGTEGNRRARMCRATGERGGLARQSASNHVVWEG